MSLRAVAAGILLALFISCFTYLNDVVIRGSGLISHFMPIGVFGVLMVLLLVVNPLLRALNPRWPLRASELAIAGALGLAACGWPGSSFYRCAPAVVSMPRHMEKTATAWQSQNVMSYLPDGSPLLAQGQVADWRALAAAIAAADDAGPGPAKRIRDAIEPGLRPGFVAAAQASPPSPEQIDAMTAALNRVIASETVLYDAEAFAAVELNATARTLLDRGAGRLSALETTRLNRALLVSAFPGLVLPPPEGRGVLLSPDEEGSRVIDALLAGRPAGDRLSLRRIPWHAWRPAILFWGSIALLMGMAVLCMALIVHPQWYQRELLPYPIARFVGEVAARKPGAWLPDVARHSGFWVALGVVFGLRLLNGLATWFPQVPAFPLSFGVEPLRELFPVARRVPWSWGLWRIWLFPTVIAFAFFLNTRVAFTLGIANIAWTVFGSILIARGIPLTYAHADIQKVDMLRFGSYLGMALMMVYTGRRYYAHVAAGALGFRRGGEAPAYAVWAARGLVLSLTLSVLLLRAAGLAVFWGAACVLLTLLVFTIMSRIVAETGLFFLQAFVVPIGVLTALFGVAAIGPTGFLIIALAGAMLLGDTRELLMPFLSTGLRMGDETGRASPARLAPWLILVVVLGFVAAGAVTMYLQHNRGLDPHDAYATRIVPGAPFSQLAMHTSDMTAQGVLVEATTRSALRRLGLFAPAEGAYFWAALGLAIVLLTAFARLRLPWWPLHPVLFLVWGTYPLMYFGNAFLIGWGIKAAVVKTMGASGYHRVKPIMVGLIAGDLLGGLLWIAVGAIYYFTTGRSPVLQWFSP